MVSNHYYNCLYSLVPGSLVPNHVVEEGSAIELSCEIDEYPEDLVIIWKKKLDQWNREAKLAMGPSILNGDSRASVKIEKDGDHKVCTGSTIRN